jgi:hypothetical protein
MSDVAYILIILLILFFIYHYHKNQELKSELDFLNRRLYEQDLIHKNDLKIIHRNDKLISSCDSHQCGRISKKFDNIKQRIDQKKDEFKQVGILSSLLSIPNSSEILPLYSRVSSKNSNRYQYYTMSHGNVGSQYMVPLSFKNRDCMDEMGCEEISESDLIFIPQFQKTYHVTLYKIS